MKLVNLREVSLLLLKFIPVTSEQLSITFKEPDVLMTSIAKKMVKKEENKDNG